MSTTDPYRAALPNAALLCPEMLKVISSPLVGEQCVNLREFLHLFGLEPPAAVLAALAILVDDGKVRLDSHHTRTEIFLRAAS